MGRRRRAAYDWRARGKAWWARKQGLKPRHDPLGAWRMLRFMLCCDRGGGRDFAVPRQADSKGLALMRSVVVRRETGYVAAASPGFNDAVVRFRVAVPLTA